MPKRVDRDARRAQIAGALLEVMATGGLEAVSLRHVAAEAGVSTGMLQHYFDTKEQMLRFALETVSERVQARIAAKAATLPMAPSPKTIVRELLVEMLPLDQPRRLEGHVAIAFGAQVAVMPSLADTIRDGIAQLQQFLTIQIQAAHGTADHGDCERRAIALLALIDGLTFHILGQHVNADVALAVFDQHLDDLFASRPKA